MKNSIKLLLTSIAGILVFSNQGYSMNPALLAGLNKQKAGAVSSSTQSGVVSEQEIINHFSDTKKGAIMRLKSDLLVEVEDNLQFNNLTLMGAHEIVLTYIEEFHGTKSPDEKNDIATLLFGTIISKTSSKALELVKKLTSETPEERARRIDAKKSATIKKMTGGSADLQMGSDGMKELQRAQEERKRRKAGGSPDSTSSSPTEIFRSAEGKISATAPYSPHQANSSPFQVPLKSTLKKEDRNSTASIESLGTSSGLSSVHSSLSHIPNPSSARTSPEFRTPTTTKLSTPTTELTIDDLM